MPGELVLAGQSLSCLARGRRRRTSLALIVPALRRLPLPRFLPAGASWSVPTRLTHGLSIVSANNGVDVSGGRVTKAYEVIPSMAEPVAATNLTKVRVVHSLVSFVFARSAHARACGAPAQRACRRCSPRAWAALQLCSSERRCHRYAPSRAHPSLPPSRPQDVRVEVAAGGAESETWAHQPFVDLPVLDTQGFLQYTLLKVSALTSCVKCPLSAPGGAPGAPLNSSRQQQHAAAAPSAARKQPARSQRCGLHRLPHPTAVNRRWSWAARRSSSASTACSPRRSASGEGCSAPSGCSLSVRRSAAAAHAAPTRPLLIDTPPATLHPPPAPAWSGSTCTGQTPRWSCRKVPGCPWAPVPRCTAASTGSPLR